jgi:hypothetical protein
MKEKIHLGHTQLQIDHFTHNNQTAATEASTKGRHEEREARGSHDTIVSGGGVRVDGGKKLK